MAQDPLAGVLAGSRGFQVRLDRYLRRQTGLSLSQYRILHHLVAARRQVPLGELARVLGCTRGNVSGLTERLHVRGYIRRQYGTRDRRVVHVTATPAGEEALRRLEALVRAFLAEDAARAPRPLARAELVIVPEDGHGERWIAVEPPDGEREVAVAVDVPAAGAAAGPREAEGR